MNQHLPFTPPRMSDPRLTTRRYQMLVGGKSIDAESGETIERESPAYARPRRRRDPARLACRCRAGHPRGAQGLRRRPVAEDERGRAGQDPAPHRRRHHRQCRGARHHRGARGRQGHCRRAWRDEFLGRALALRRRPHPGPHWRNAQCAGRKRPRPDAARADRRRRHHHAVELSAADRFRSACPGPWAPAARWC